MPDTSATGSEGASPQVPGGPRTADHGELRKLHPATIAINLSRRLGQIVWFVLLGLFFGDEESRLSLVAVLTLFPIIGSFLSYMRFRYGIQGDRLVIKSGIIQRQSRTIPINRIQNVDFQRGVLHKIFNVVDVRIETAAGADAEGELSVLHTEVAQAFRRQLFAQRGEATEAEASVDEATAEVLWKSRLSDLLIVGATANRAGVLVAGMLALTQWAGQSLEEIEGPMQRYAQRMSELAETQAALLAIGVIGTVFVVGWVLSIVLTLVEYYGFTLRRRGDQLRRRYGLLTSHESVLPLRRIQIVRLESPLLRQWLGRTTVYAETAGSAADQQGGGATTISPLASWREAAVLCSRVLADFDLEKLPWQAVSRKTIRRGAVRYTLIGAALAALLGWGTDWWNAVYVLPVVLAIAVVAAYARFRAFGYCELPEMFVARSGVFTRRIWIVPRAKVQFAAAEQSPFQRPARLATLKLYTAGVSMRAAPEVVDLPVEVAEGLTDQLSHDAFERGAWLLDGV